VLFVSSLLVQGVPRGAQVVFSSPNGRESLTATGRSGTVRSMHVVRAGLAFRYGAAIAIRVTKPGYVGAYIALRVDSRLGVRRVQRLCIAALGSPSPVRCGGNLKGR
jgi:hypothetical protein